VPDFHGTLQAYEHQALVWCSPEEALGWYLAALVVILLNRLLDGLDGALARRRGLTDAGGFLDISLDFLFYALVPFGFILAA
ncbi:CDP-alcohol phosphatidyltransferase family protein, partial [Escherichia sp. SS-MK2]